MSEPDSDGDDYGANRCGECGAHFFSKWGHRKDCSLHPERNREMKDTDRVVLDLDEARRIANSLEYVYTATRENAYEATDEQAARDAMMIRDRGRIEPNPQLLDSNVDPGVDR